MIRLISPLFLLCLPLCFETYICHLKSKCAVGLFPSCRSFVTDTTNEESFEQTRLLRCIVPLIWAPDRSKDPRFLKLPVDRLVLEVKKDFERRHPDLSWGGAAERAVL
jgi:hypothetical protein